MNAVSSYAVTERPLESLGISPSEESAYVALLDHPEATLAELATALAWPARKVQRLLDGLQGMGLVTFAAG
jgi:sugar-specific transcriptional regulator TrmB